MEKKELLGKKIVPIFSTKETRVFTVTSTSEYEVEGRRDKTTAYFGFSGIRLATDAEVVNDGRFEGSCPHKYVSYRETIKKQRIPFERQEYKEDMSQLSGMHTNAYICDWCGQHIDWDSKVVLKPPSHW